LSNDFKNLIAEVDYPDSGWIVTPNEARQLKAKGHDFFFCPDYTCKNKRLTVKRSILGNFYFSHHPGCGHEIIPETLLHKMAVRWFDKKTEFEIPAHESEGKALKQQTVQLDATQTQLEYNFKNTIIPDVLLHTVKGFRFAVEIVVTNDVNSAKAKKIEQFNLPTLRIDLSGFYQREEERCKTDKWFIQANLDKLLTDINLKSWVLPPAWEVLPADLEVIHKTEPEPSPPPVQQEEQEPEPAKDPALFTPTKSDNSDFWIFAVLVAAIAAIFYWLSGRGKNSD
jgi:hypothetical protein